MPVISIKDCPLAFSQSEARIEPLAKTIGVVSVDFCGDLHIVVREDQLAAVGREESGVVDPSRNPEVEWVFGVVQVEGGQVEREAEVAERVGREDALLRHLETLLAGVGDADVEVAEGQRVELEGELLGDGAGFLHIVVVSAGVGEGEDHRVETFLGVRDTVLREAGRLQQHHSQAE